ncbi:1,4-beta-N-acetylmuramidase [Bifidobacterium italicum]|uniref:1,4-beta-N-acetylmuramidase n=2 Tax=Bifidobacterium italicum TaxID=1960968 RepID=A0A2A2EJY1_9BIFI|nr:1,4-beta-N-acetylmuramidase [Bifidobacterium italicum]
MAQHSHRRAASFAACILAGALTLTGTSAGVSAAYADDPAAADTVRTMPTDTGAGAAATPQMEVPDEDVPPNPEHMWNNADTSQDPGAGDGTAPQSGSRLRRAAPQAQWGWRTTGPNNAYKTFRQSDGTVMNPVLKVIDVSEHQGSIDWNKVKNSGIDGVILRIGYGYGYEDARFAQYLAQVRALKIPFGIYHYSYAYDTDFALEEGRWTVELLRKYGVTDNAFPIFYDLEQDDWGGHKMPTAASQYERIARTYFGELSTAGYRDVYIYSYLNNMNTRLNTTWLQARTKWIAQYNTELDYEFPNYNGTRGWQYTSKASVSGIGGVVDMSVFDRSLYRDVTFRTPHYDDVVWLSQYGVTTGFPDGTFRGMSAVVRQDMAAFLRRVAANRNIGDAKTWKPGTDDWKTFTDVNSQTPHAEDILWLAHAGIADGYANADGTQRYGGMTTVYRQDMAAFLKRLADLAGKSGGVTPRTDFTDVHADTPHAAEIQWLGGARITDGYRNANGSWRFEGMTTVYRQDMAAFLHRLDNRLA